MAGRLRKEYTKGQILGELIFIEYSVNISKPLKAIFKCKCGKLFEACVNSVIRKNTKSCGCLRKLFTNMQNENVPGYSSWLKMKERCYNPKNKAYKDYGGRGITVCNRWLETGGFKNFIEDMGIKPSKKHSIDRIDNNGNYCKENCRWATKLEQQNNTRKNRFITYEGKTQTISQWEEELKIKKGILYPMNNLKIENFLKTLINTPTYRS